MEANTARPLLELANDGFRKDNQLDFFGSDNDGDVCDSGYCFL